MISGAGVIAGDTVTIPGGPAVIKFEASYGGWGVPPPTPPPGLVNPLKLKTFQLTLDPAGLSSGGGTPLFRPATGCGDAGGDTSPDCVLAYGAGNLPSPSDLRCNDPFLGECNNLWEETGRADYITGFGLPACAQAGLTCGDTTFGAGTLDTLGERYAFSAVFGADGGAAGTYTLQLDPLNPALGANFLQVADPTGLVDLLPIQKTIPAFVVIPVGRCCTNPGTPDCVAGKTKSQCDALGGLFAANTLCPADGGPPCAECTAADGQPDPLCNDGDSCTSEVCVRAECVYSLKAGFNPATQCCDPCSANGTVTDITDDDDPCTDDKCVFTGVCGPPVPPTDNLYDPAARGAASHVDNPAGTACNDGNPCTYSDNCDATGGCAGVNVNGEACGNDAACQNHCSGVPGSPKGPSCDPAAPICPAGSSCVADTPGAVCLATGVCECRLNPNVFIGLTHEEPIGDKDNACYADNEKVTATVHIGPAANNIVGVQFAIVYNPDCLAFQSIQPAGPWSSILMVRLGGTCAGGVRDGQVCGAQGCGQNGTCVPDDTIFYAAGIPLGGDLGICDGGSNDKGFCNFAPDSCPGGVCLPIGPGQGSQGNSDAAVLVFSKRPGCFGKPGEPECEICFSDNNPLHTYFSDDTGQAIGADTKCSEGIRTKSPIDLVTPETIKVNKGCDSNVATVTWPNPSASFGCSVPGVLVCNGIHLESGTLWDQGHVLKGGVFPGGNSNFTCTATNNCGNVLEKKWTVTVNDRTSLEVEIQLSPTMKTKPNDPLTRCIKFQVFNNCVQAPQEFSTDVEFGGLLQLTGHFNGHVKIPYAVQPACITARDQKHTLRSCYTFGEGDCDADGVLHAAFKGDPFFGGNWLIGGNLDGWKKDVPTASHDIVDILDFGSLVSQWLRQPFDSDGDGNADGNTPCGVFAGTHADINGDGEVNLLDFSYIAMNFLDNSKDCCCPGSASLGNTVGRTEISVRELREQGMSDLAVADLNADGKVDMADMAALMQGVRPNLKTNDSGKDGSRSNNRK
jgi:hypothetical protein